MSEALLTLADVAADALPALAETASGRRWRLRDADERVALAIAQNEGVDPVIARALAARGVDVEGAGSYLRPTLRASLPDPLVLRDMDKAVARLAAAASAGETIGVFGDYDVDGTTASAVLLRYFRAIGVPARAYLPDRLLEGYGPSIDAFRALSREGARVIVTVDCGANAERVIEEAACEGLDLVVVDHHQMNGPPPPHAVACVNPNRPDDLSGLGGLSASGLAFLTVVAVNRGLREAGYFKTRAEPDLKALLDLAALGLVCDVMPMTGLARVLVAHGLSALARGGNAGLAALGARAGAKGAPSVYSLGFLLGPRINAAGRVGHARLALDLLMTDDPARAASLAETLHLLNAERQAIEAAVLDAAVAQAERNGAPRRGVVVCAGEGWHPGVIGVVAGRLKERYDLPTVVVALDGETGKGSGRSLAGVDLGAAIAAAKAEGLLLGGGGHAMAAGLTIAASRVDELAAFLDARLGADVERARADRALLVDAVVAPTAVGRALGDMIEKAGPFGPGNPEPVFALANVLARDVRTVGGAHLAVTLAGEGGAARAIAFRAAEGPLGDMLRAGRRLHVAGRIRADDWRGGDAAQLQIEDAALPA